MPPGSGGRWRGRSGRSLSRSDYFSSASDSEPGSASSSSPDWKKGDLALQVWRLPSISLTESVSTALDIERVLRRFPEVTQVVTRTGSPEVATDVMGVELSDVFVILKPQREWVTAHSPERSDREDEGTPFVATGARRRPRIHPTHRDAVQ